MLDDCPYHARNSRCPPQSRPAMIQGMSRMPSRSVKKTQKKPVCLASGVAKQTGWCLIMQHLFNYATHLKHRQVVREPTGRLSDPVPQSLVERSNASLNSVRCHLLAFPNHCSEWRLRVGSWRNPAASLDSGCLFRVLKSLFRPRRAAGCLKAYSQIQLLFRTLPLHLACQNLVRAEKDRFGQLLG